jgi:PDZ domain-containing protein
LKGWLQSPWRVLGGLIVLVLVTGVILLRIPSDKILLTPDPAHPVAPLVRVQGAHPAHGGAVYFVDVQERRASELEAMFPWLHSHATLLPANEVVAPCSSDQENLQEGFREMALSQRIAAAVALERLGYHVGVRPNGVLVSQLIAGTHAPCNLQPTDRIVAVDGTATPTVAKLHKALGELKPGAVAALRLRRGQKNLTVRIRTVDDPQDPARALVGFAPAQSAQITLPIKVDINASGVGGPSAGLAFALEVMQKLGHDVSHGNRIAATGEMNLDGSVSAIGGVKQKTYGVRAAHIGIFLVPAGGNAATARHFAGPVKIIAVTSFAQALRALATLPHAG